jgi:hypothetical protein
MMASKKDFDPLDNLKPYEGESFVAPTTSLGMPQTGEQSSLKNLLENYGWMIPAVGIPVYAGSKAYNFLTKESETKTGQADQEIPKKSIKDRFFGQPDKPIGPQTNIEKQLGDLDINTLPKDQRETVNVLIDAERKRMAKQQEAITAINDASQGKIPLPQNITPTISSGNPIQSIGVAPVSTPEVPTIAQLGQQATGTAPIAPPTTTEQIATEAVEGKKKGRPAGAKNLTEEQRLAAQASKGTNMYLNMFGFDKNDPTSPKSLAAVESTQRFINEAMGGVPPASRDPLLNPEGDIAPSGKKFYSGTPEGYRNAYIPWLQENLHTLPPETQSHVLHAMTKGQTGDIGKLVKGMGLAGILGASGAAFSAPVQNRARDVRNAIGEALLPLGVTPSELQPGTLGPEQIRAFQEAQKLGSPYRSVPPPR